MRKPAPAGIYLATAFAVAFLINMTYVAANFYAIELRATARQIGLLGSMVTGIYCVMCPLFGWLVGRSDPKRKVLAAALLYVAFIPGIPFAGSFWPVATLVVLIGIPGGLFWPTIEDVICAGRTRAQMRRNLGSFCVLWCSGMTCGTLLSGPLFEWSHVAPFWLAGLVALGLVALFAAAPSPRTCRGEQGAAGSANGADDHAPPELARNFLYLARVANFLVYVALACVRFLFPKYGIDELTMSETGVAGLLFLTALGQTSAFVVLRHTGFWHYRYWPVTVCVMAAGVGFWVLTATTVVWVFAVCLTCIGITAGMTYFASIYYAMARPDTGARHAAWHESVLGLGSALGPIMGGELAQRTGDLTAPFKMSAAVCLLCLALMAVLFLRRSRRARPD